MLHYERESHTKKEFEKHWVPPTPISEVATIYMVLSEFKSTYLIQWQSVSHLSDNDSLNVSLSVKTPQSFSRKDSWALNLRYRFILIVILDSVNFLIVTSGSG